MWNYQYINCFPVNFPKPIHRRENLASPCSSKSRMIRLRLGQQLPPDPLASIQGVTWVTRLRKPLLHLYSLYSIKPSNMEPCSKLRQRLRMEMDHEMKKQINSAVPKVCSKRHQLFMDSVIGSAMGTVASPTGSSAPSIVEARSWTFTNCSWAKSAGSLGPFVATNKGIVEILWYPVGIVGWIDDDNNNNNNNNNTVIWLW